MSFITKNANTVLLFLLVISSLALIGATIFFQLNFERINTEYNYKVQQLRQVNTDLQTQQELLEKIKGELSVRTAREEEFTEKYTEVRTTKEQLETQKLSLEEQKNQLQQDLQETATELTSVTSELESARDRIDNLEAEILELEDDNEILKRAKDDLEDQLSACQANCS